MIVLNYHCMNTPNVGDRYCAAGEYFPVGAQILDWSQVPKSLENSAVILGGGGLAYPGALHLIERIISAKPKRLIAWGVGTNTHDKESDPYPEWLSDCDLVGVRDSGTKHEWAPCPSCMSPLF